MQDKFLVFPEPSPGDKAQLVTHTLPVSLTSLIGREHEVKVLHALLLRPDVRLLTLTGTPGVGKTRLALEVARELVYHFMDGVHVVSIAPISDPAFVIAAIAHSIGLTESGSQPVLDRLKTSQRDKHRLLLLDNFEQVIPAATLLAELLEACPDVKILVTSREVLRLRAEHQFAVLPLALPDPKHFLDDRSLAHVPAVHLFIQRAQALKSDFQVTMDNAATIVEICIRLDGLPLAIELAAARITLFPPQTLLARLDRRLHVLTGGARDLPERQRTLHNTITWSYNLLDTAEQRLFRCLSVFVGGCTLEAAEAVCGARDNASADLAGSMLDGVASLINKSLVQQTAQEGEQSRLVMLETIREYGLEVLAANREMEFTRQAHATCYLRFSEEAEPELHGPQQAVWLERLEQEHDNLRAALQWLLEQTGDEEVMQTALRLGGALERFWAVHGHISEGRNFLERALAASKGIEASVQAKALITAAYLTFIQSDYDRAEPLFQEGLALYRELEDQHGIAFALSLLGSVAWTKGHMAKARTLTEEALAIARQVDDMERAANSLFILGLLSTSQGEYARACALYEESLAIHRAMRNKRGIAHTLSQLAQVLLVSQADRARVSSLLEECLAVSREVGFKEGIAAYYGVSGQLALSQGDLVKARSLAEKSVAVYREIGHRHGTTNSLGLLAKVTALEGDYAAACALYEEGLALAKEIGDQRSIAFYLEGLAQVVALQGEQLWAARLWGAAKALHEAINTPLPPVERADYERSVAAARGSLGEKAFTAAWTQGRIMSPEQALAAQGRETIKTLPADQPPTSPMKSSITYPNGLTVREVEVLRLLAQGLTSAQIAERLVIGLVTVNSHVRSIYSKLGLTSRAAATRYALEHHLL